MRSMFRSLPGRAALLATLVAAAGCEAVAAGDDFTVAYDGYLNKCASCHSPGNQPSGAESSLDFSTADTARASLKGGSAAGLVGNQAACNGVPFVVAGKPGESLVMAVLDETVRQNFDNASAAGCDGSGAISDMTVRVGGSDADAIAKLRAWIEAGAE